jgi:hypothetical protein
LYADEFNLHRFIMKLKFSTLLFIAVITAIGNTNTSAQTYTKCGTQVTPALVAKVIEAATAQQQKVNLYVPDKCLNKTLSVTAHIISDSLGNYGLSAADVTTAIQGLNPLFSPICLSFEVCTVNFIKNYKYNDFLQPDEEAELINLYSIPNTINMYFAKGVQPSPGNYVGGYAYLPGGEDFIMISKGSLGSIPHEMGHFLGLLHTFETSNGLELANGTNCLTAGDLVCDTPADPGLGNYPAPNCNLFPGATDPNGDWYVPDIGNIMSYYGEDCKCGFTVQQYNRMALMYLTSNRFLLW